MKKLLRSVLRFSIGACASLTLIAHAATVSLVGPAEQWRYLVATNMVEASEPWDAWRTNSFVEDGKWGSGAMPIGFATTANDPLGYEARIVTFLPQSSAANYTAVFIRKTFSVTNIARFKDITLGLAVDDGAVAWLNGKEIMRFQCCAGGLDPSFPTADAAATGASESAVMTNTIPNDLSSPLLEGTNVLCIQLFNGNLTSSDLVLEATLTGIVDDEAPTVVSQVPEPATTVTRLTAIQVTFSEEVTGVDAADLRINGQPAQDVIAASPLTYTFTFPQPATGTVSVAFAPGHGITDTAVVPNAFGGASWSYNLNTNVAMGGFMITEFLASNSGKGVNALRDQDGDASDWIEIYNPNNSVGDLTGWALTDDQTALTKWKFPAGTTIPARGYLIVFASNKNRTNPLGQLHANFALSADGEYLALVNYGVTPTNVASAFAAIQQYEDVSYGRDRSNPSFIGYYTTPTPGADNVVGGSGFSGEVEFSVTGRTFTGSFPLTLSVNDTNSEIRYVLVNTAQNFNNATNIPTSASTLYTAPINITGTVQVRARAFSKNGTKFPGPPRTESYIQLGTASNYVSTLPIVVIHTMGSSGISGGFPAADNSVIFACFETNENGVASLASKPQTMRRAGINLRGSSTQGYSKSSYAVEIWDEFNEDDSASVLGMPGESDWVLYAPNQFDHSLMHNPLMHQWGRDMGQYSSRTRFVEVFFRNNSGALTCNTNSTGTGMGDYSGIYVLEEKIKRDNDRVDIHRLEAGDTNATRIAGGYILKIDRKDPNERSVPAGGIPGTTTDGGQGLIFVEPDGLEMVTLQRAAQSNYIVSYLNLMNSTLQGATLTNGTGTNHYSHYLDIEKSIDIHIGNVLTLNVDGYRLSGYMHKPRDGKLIIGPLWDCDRGQGTSAKGGDWRAFNPRCWQASNPLGASDYGTDFFQNTSPSVNVPPWFVRLFSDPDFWQTWIDRYQQYRSTIFDTNRIASVIDGFANQVREAQQREYRRWAPPNSGTGSDTSPRTGTATSPNGDFSHTFPSTVNNYQGEIDFQKRWYFERLRFFDTNFLNRPSLSVAQGMVGVNTMVTIADTSGKAGTQIYYTLDGSDPRQSLGKTNSAARLYTGPITITNNVRIRARAVNANHRNLTGVTGASRNPVISSPWSGDVAATYYITAPTLAITEIMYHPANPPAGNTNDADNFEYIELKNIGTNAINLVGIRFTNGISYTFTSNSLVKVLAPGEYVLLVKNMAAFLSRYGANNRIAGEFGGNLDNAGERLVLVGAALEPILDFAYSDEWLKLTDGSGFSLVLRNELTNPTNYSHATNWTQSFVEGGSPGMEDSGPRLLPRIVISEALTHTDLPQVDVIELHNLEATNVNVGGWFLTDDFERPKKYAIPAGTVIPARGFITVQETQFNMGPNAFGLSSEGDDVYVFSGEVGKLTGWFHGFDFGPSQNGVTFGRYVRSDGVEEFVAQSADTLGSSNALPLVGPIVISEVHYHPPELGSITNLTDNGLDEFVELQNIGNSPVNLYDTNLNTWRLTKGVDFVFPPNVVVPVGGFVLLVNFNPQDTLLLDGFKAKFNVPAGVQFFGPYGGKLDNSGETVKLSRPDATNIVSGFIPFIQVDRVQYRDSAPWAGAADGFGPSLQRVVVGDFGNDPTNWVAALPTPGRTFVPGTPPTITQQPQGGNVIESTTTPLTVVATGTPPLGYQWRFNGSALPGATNSTFVIQNATITDSGVYNVAVFNSGGAVMSSSATVTVRALPRITLNPVNRTNAPGSNVTFTAEAAGTGQITYQWRKDGQNIPAANSASLTVSNLDLFTHAGYYDVVATDDIGSATSQQAVLNVAVRPLITEPPVSMTVVQGGTAYFRVVAGPIHPFQPLTYRWFLTNGTPVGNTNSMMMVTNCQVNNSVRLNVSNPAGQTNITSGVRIIVLPDGDGDGIPDEWEDQYGFDKNSDQDAGLDSDGDGMTTVQEYAAGTDPLDPQSYLRFDNLTLDGNDQAVLGFTAVSNRMYHVQASDDLSITNWTTVFTLGVSTNNRTISVTNDVPGVPSRYFRIQIPTQ